MKFSRTVFYESLSRIYKKVAEENRAIKISEKFQFIRRYVNYFKHGQGKIA